jgi:hypothetical protein
MYGTVMTSVAALAVVVPMLVVASPSAEAGRHSAGRYSGSPSRGATGFKSSRPMILRQKFNRVTQGNRSRHLGLNKGPSLNTTKLAPKLSKVPTLGGPTATKPLNKLGKGGGNPTPSQGNPTPDPRKIGNEKVRQAFEAQEKAGTISPHAKQRLNEDRAARIAESGPTKALGKLGKQGGNPTPGQGENPTPDPRKIGNEKVRQAFEAQEKAGTISPHAQQRLNEDRAARIAEQQQGAPRNPDTGNSGAGGDDKPNTTVIIVPGRGDGQGASRGDGDRQVGGGYRYAPSMLEPGSPYAAPRYQAQPQQLQPAKIKKDESVCVEGVWAMQDNEKKYVCLSWYFRGRIYTPDQMAQILAQLQPQAQ